jgi:AraC-like DNA-binding protein
MYPHRSTSPDPTTLTALDAGTSETSSTSGFSVHSITCSGEPADWCQAEPLTSYGVVLVRSGRFLWCTNGPVETADPSTGYMFTPDGEMCFAHPFGGDVCTAISVDVSTWHDVVGDRIRGAWALPVPARLELAHRWLLRSGVDQAYVGHKRLIELLTAGLSQMAPVIATQAGSTASRRIVTAARAAILEQHPDAHSLNGLAKLLGVSPYHLSRTFHRQTGLTMARYRNRVRVGLALARIEEGETNLAALAADLGFADQAHLCRVLRAELGRTPRQIGRLLRSGE